MINFICLSILLMPWIITPDPLRLGIDTVWLPKYIFFDILCLSSLGFMFLREPEVRYSNKPLAWVMLWAVISFSFFWFKPFLFPIAENNNYIVNFALWNLIPSLHLIFGGIFFFFLVVYLSDEEWVKVLKYLVISCVCACVFALFQSFGFDPFLSIPHQYFSDNHLIALLGNASIVGAFSALVIPYLYGEKSFKSYAFLSILLFAVFRSLSFLALLGVILSFLCFLILTKKKRLLLIFAFAFILLFMLVYFIKPEYFNLAFRLKGRLEVWGFLMDKVRSNPFLGHGLGSWSQLEYGKSVGSAWLWAHNDYLQMIYELGFLGFGLFIWALSNTFLKVKAKFKELTIWEIKSICSLTVFLVLMAGIYPFQIAPLALCGLLSFANLERKI